MMIHWSISIEGPPLGLVHEKCPHCNTRQGLERRALVGRMGFVPVPSGEVLTCPSCGKHSRKEGRASRIAGAVFLLPFVLVLGAGFAAGLYFLASMVGGEFSLAYAAAAVGFMSLTGHLGYRTALSIRRLLGPTTILPMDGLMTRL